MKRKELNYIDEVKAIEETRIKLNNRLISKLSKLETKEKKITSDFLNAYKKEAKIGRSNFLYNLQLKRTLMKESFIVYDTDDNNKTVILYDFLDNYPNEQFAFKFFSVLGPMELFNVYRTSKTMRKHLLLNISSLCTQFLERIQLSWNMKHSNIEKLTTLKNSILCLSKHYGEKEEIEGVIPILLFTIHDFFISCRSYGKLEIIEKNIYDNSNCIHIDYSFIYDEDKKTFAPFKAYNILYASMYNYYRCKMDIRNKLQNINILIEKYSTELIKRKKDDGNNRRRGGWFDLFDHTDLINLLLLPVKRSNNLYSIHDLFVIRGDKIEKITKTSLKVFTFKWYDEKEKYRGTPTRYAFSDENYGISSLFCDNLMTTNKSHVLFDYYEFRIAVSKFEEEESVRKKINT